MTGGVTLAGVSPAVRDALAFVRFVWRDTQHWRASCLDGARRPATGSLCIARMERGGTCGWGDYCLCANATPEVALSLARAGGLPRELPMRSWIPDPPARLP